MKLRLRRKGPVTIGSSKYVDEFTIASLSPVIFLTIAPFSFLQAVADPSILEECGLDEKTKTVLLENIQQKLTQQAVKIRADVEVACYTYEGIDAVKEALR